MKKILGLAAALGCTACSPGSDSAPADAKGAFMANDFESLRGWVDPNLIDPGQAHSGKYSSRVDKDHEFGVTYEMPLGKISDHKIKAMHLEAWVYLPNAQAAVVGTQIIDPAQANKAVGGDGIKLEEVKTFNKWVKVEKDMPMPDFINSAMKIRVFLWRGLATEPVYMDDIKMSIKE